MSINKPTNNPIANNPICYKTKNSTIANPNTQLQNISIIGTGAMGCLWATKLAARFNVQLINREFLSKDLSKTNLENEKSISIESASKNSQIITLPINNKALFQNADYLLFTVKAYDLIDSIKKLSTLINKSLTVMILHNGMGTQNLIKELLPYNKLLFINTTHGCYLEETSKKLHKKINYEGVGISYIGSINHDILIDNSEKNLLVGTLNKIIPKVIWQDDIFISLWQKLAINAVINPLATIYKCTNGELLNNKYEAQINLIINEICQISELEGYPMRYEALKEQIKLVMKNTANNRCSMLQDNINSRHTEIDYITGYLLYCAKKHKIGLPENQRIYLDLKI